MELPLFASTEPTWLTSPSTRLEKRFAAFHRSNPHVFGRFEELALEAFSRGARRIGAKAIAERIRWDVRIRTLGDEFKLNNSYVALYARLLLFRRPEMGTLIETRRRVA